MNKYIIERKISKIGTLGQEQLRQAASKSNQALEQLGSDIRWLESFVAADKMFCVYLAKDEAIIHRHAELSGFPASKVTEIGKMIDPTTALSANEQHGSALEPSSGSGNTTFKEKLHKALAVCAFVFILIGPATAQNVTKATIPFDFKVGDTTLNAGEYCIERVSSEHPELLALRDNRGEPRVIISGVRIEVVENNGHARLLFTKLDNHYFLSQIWQSDTGSGTSVPKTRLERELAANRRHRAQTKVVGMAP